MDGDPGKGYAPTMGIRSTVAGWLGQGAAKDDELEKAHQQEVEDEYLEDKLSTPVDLRTGMDLGGFESDQEAPRH